MTRILVSLSLIITLFSCQEDMLADENIVYEDIYNLNKNVSGLKSIGKMIMEGDYINSFYYDNQNAYQTLNLTIGENKTEASYYFYSNNNCPKVSFKMDNARLYWTLNDNYILDGNGYRIQVIDHFINPLFKYEDGTYHISTDKGKSWSLVWGNPINENNLSVESLGNDYFATLTVDNDLSFDIPTEKLASLIRKDVKNKAFYKDVFHDAGIHLTSRTSLPAVSYLKLSYERITCEDDDSGHKWQSKIFGGSGDDENGRLLFPDGQPRYRLFFVNGGNAMRHGKSLEDIEREHMKEFVRNGGGYVGTCAGAFFGCNGYIDRENYEYYLSVWPGLMKSTGISNSKTGMFIEERSPLLQYYSFGDDHYVADVRHNGGGYAFTLPEGTEVLARYDCPEHPNVHMEPSIWSYKKNPYSGMVILEGSHPEEVTNGERRDLTAAMIRYVIDNIGDVRSKGFLYQGITRHMDKPTSDSIPSLTKIGDLQCHHFVVYIPENAHNIKFQLECATNCQLNLMLSNKTYAFAEDAEYINNEISASKTLIFDVLPSGLWYVAVQNMTTVEVEEVDKGQEYMGRTDILNGVSYSITVSWN